MMEKKSHMKKGKKKDDERNSSRKTISSRGREERWKGKLEIFKKLLTFEFCYTGRK